jgi:23S rRNA (cytosine1962-C5)-methyltransferase
LASAQRNFALNTSVPQIASCPHQMIQADTFQWLAAKTARSYDLIVLDPPSLARREAERAGALQAYERLVRLAIGRLDTGGVLLACSCSAHVTATEFFERVWRSARAVGRRCEELRTAGHPPDHRATFKEAEYLKAIYLRFID